MLIFISSFSVAMSSEEQAQMNQVEREKASYVQQLKNNWDSCRKTCKVKNCPSNIVCIDSPSDEECDKKYCHTQKLNYETHKKKLDDMISARNEHKKLKTEEASKSPLEQVQKKKKETNLLAYVGVGTTAFLGYKAKTTCSSCCWVTHPSCCGQCAMLLGMTAAAGLQTKAMFGKKNELGETAQALCTTVNDPSCSDYDSDNPNNDDSIYPPGCQGLQANCDRLEPILDPFKCAPGDVNCLKKEDPKDPTNTLAGDTFVEDLFDTLKPQKGWPKGKSPLSDSSLAETKAFNYNKLTPAQKKQAQKIMANLNKKNTDFLEKHGVGDSNEEDLGILAQNDTNLNKGLSANFNKIAGDESSRSPSDNMVSSTKPKSSIADQMKEMLKKMHGMAGDSKKGIGFLGDKSVLIGSDSVGVREDNIFMMVHRMNRKLDEKEQRFIKAISY